jgi:hypothetical protein
VVPTLDSGVVMSQTRSRLRNFLPVSIGYQVNRRQIRQDNCCPPVSLVDAFAPALLVSNQLGAYDGTRTRDSQIMDLMLYLLSYFNRCTFRTRTRNTSLQPSTNGLSNEWELAPPEATPTKRLLKNENAAIRTPSTDLSNRFLCQQNIFQVTDLVPRQGVEPRLTASKTVVLSITLARRLEV